MPATWQRFFMGEFGGSRAVPPRGDEVRASALATFLGYLVLVLVPAGMIAKPLGEHARSSLWWPAVAGVVAAPLFAGLTARHRRSVPGARTDRESERRDRYARWIEKGRMATLWGLVGAYAGYILVSICGVAVSDGRPIYVAGIPGLTVAVLAPIAVRVLVLGDCLRRAVFGARARRGVVTERVDDLVHVRLEDGSIVRIDAGSASGAGKREPVGAVVWFRGGRVDASPTSPYRHARDGHVGAELSTRSDRAAMRRIAISHALELAVLPIVPALWLGAL